MGRYYKGDIEGKFWFAVQDSTDGEFFGMQEDKNYIRYYSEDLDSAKKGVKQCKKELGKYKKKLDNFFEKKNSYNNEMLIKELDVNEVKVKELLTWYARLYLGEEILRCIKKNGCCGYEAEL